MTPSSSSSLSLVLLPVALHLRPTPTRLFAAVATEESSKYPWRSTRLQRSCNVWSSRKIDTGEPADVLPSNFLKKFNHSQRREVCFQRLHFKTFLLRWWRITWNELAQKRQVAWSLSAGHLHLHVCWPTSSPHLSLVVCSEKKPCVDFHCPSNLPSLASSASRWQPTLAVGQN